MIDSNKRLWNRCWPRRVTTTVGSGGWLCQSLVSNLRMMVSISYVQSILTLNGESSPLFDPLK